jgi:predicted MFS family arabinose efflux permease
MRLDSLAALVVGTFVGMQGIAMLPLLTGVSIDAFDLSERSGGYLGTVQLGIAAISAFLISVRIHRLNHRRLYLISAAMACIGNVLSVVAVQPRSVALLFAARALEGAGEGILIGTVNAVAAGSEKPIRSFSIMNAGFALLAAGMYLLAPRFIEAYGASGLYAMMGGLAAAAMLLGLGVSVRAVDAANASDRLQVSGFSQQGWYALIVYTLLMLVTNGTWAFVQRIGIGSAGLGTAQIGRIISVAAVLMITGPYLANLVGKRFGWVLPVVAASLAYMVVASAFATLDGEWGFAITVSCHAVVSSFAMTVMQSFLAELDATGRVVAASPAFMSLGNAVGPSAVAMALSYFRNYTGIACFAALMLSCSLLVFFLIVRSLPSQHIGVGARSSAG